MKWNYIFQKEFKSEVKTCTHIPIIKIVWMNI